MKQDEGVSMPSYCARLLYFPSKKRRSRRRGGDRALRAYAQRAAASGQPAVRDAGVSVPRAMRAGGFCCASRDVGRAALPAQPCPAGGRRSLAWFGLRWDAPPLYQSERTTVYQSHLERLRAKGLHLPLLLHAGAAAAAGLRRAQSGRYATGIRRHLRASDAGGDRAALAGTLPRPARARAG